MININNLSKSFSTLDVLKDINLQVNSGEVVVILGPSGSGKSTLLRCINGLEELTSGTIEVSNIVVDAKSSQKVRNKQIKKSVFIRVWFFNNSIYTRIKRYWKMLWKHC